MVLVPEMGNRDTDETGILLAVFVCLLGY